MYLDGYNKNMIKAIFFDIDGTLVSFATHRVPESTLRTLWELKENGILLFIATGRSRDGLGVLEEFPFDGYVTMNGQYCFRNDGAVIYENTLSRKDLLLLKEELERHPFPCGFEMPDGKIFNYRDERVDEVHAITLNDDQPAGDITGIEEKKVYQVMAFLNEEEEKEVMQKLPDCISARWFPTFCDISPVGGTKVKGMDCFAKEFGFTMEETMAFGDGGNDLAMLEHAGTGIAMANGVQALKEAADYITDDVDHEGVRKACIRYHLIKGE